MASPIFALHIEAHVEAWRLCWRLCPPPKRDLNSPSHIWESSQIKTASENVPSVLWQSSHSTEWILSRRHLSVAALPPTSSYLGRPDCPDCDRCRSRVEIWSNCKTTLSLIIPGDIFTAPQAPIQYVVNVSRRILAMQTWFNMATKMCHQLLTHQYHICFRFFLARTIANFDPSTRPLKLYAKLSNSNTINSL